MECNNVHGYESSYRCKNEGSLLLLCGCISFICGILVVATQIYIVIKVVLGAGVYIHAFTISRYTIEVKLR